MKKLTVIAAIFIAIAIFLSSCGVQEEPFRLHIIANSDSQEDQQVKLKVRDAILEYTAGAAEKYSTKEEIMDYICQNLSGLQECAEKTLLNNGFDYDASISVGNFYFPEKTYGKVTYKEGFYDGIKVQLGKAEGQNWWCVIFPPLCLFAAKTSSKDGIADKVVYKSIFSK